MTEYNSDDIQQNVKTDAGPSTDFEHFSSSTSAIQNDNSTDNDTQEMNKDLFKEAVKTSDSNNGNESLSVETGITSQNNDQITWRKIIESNNKRQEIFAKFKEASLQIKPIEFESYYDFFVLNTFKKGISASGHVDIENVIKNNAQRQRRSKRNHQDLPVHEPVNSPSPSLDKDEGSDYMDRDIGKNPRKRESTPVDEIEWEYKKRRNTTQVSEISEDYSQTQETEESLGLSYSGGGRRSTRLLNKANNKGSPSNLTTEDGTEEQGEAVIKDLYETIVPKVVQPYRRSDWVLPSRLRYTPEKQMNTKPEFEKVNLSDLISVEKIQRVLSKFEGGLKGIRKTNWNSVS